MRTMKNYLDLGSCDWGRRRLMVYADTEDYLGILPLKRHGVRLKFRKELARDGNKYHLIMLRILKKDVEKFAQAMEELKNKMLICGHTDYEELGGEFLTCVEKAFREANAKG